MSEAQSNSCQSRLRQDIPWYLNGTLSETDAALVRAHIESCDDCRADLELQSSIRSAVLGREVTPIVPQSSAADIIGLGRTGVSRPRTNRRASSQWFAAAAAVVIIGVALLVALFPGMNTEVTNQVFETATSAGSAEGIDYVLQLRFEDDVSEGQRARIAAQLEGAVKWAVNDSGVYEIHVQLAAPSLEVLKDYEMRTGALPGVQSAEFTALQLPMR